MKTKRSRLKLFIDRAFSESLGRQILGLLVILGITLLAFYISVGKFDDEWREFCTWEEVNPYLLPIYLLIDSNALNNLYMRGGVDGWLLFVSSVVYLVGIVFFNGMIISIITNAIANRVEKHRKGLLRYLKSGHYIIMGYDEMVPSIIAEVLSKDSHADVLMLTSVDADVIRKKLLKSVAKDKMEHVFITYGERTVKDCYKDIRLEHAREIYIVGKRDLPAHDAINVECVGNVFAYLKEGKFQHIPKRVICVFEDLDTYAAFKTTEIFKEQIGKLNIEFIPYNFYSGWAKQVFIKRSYKEKMNLKDEIGYPSVYGEGIAPDDKKKVHLVFVGMSNFSVAFAMEAAHLLHFPNFEKDKTSRTRITFIDKNAGEELKLFATRNRHFFEVQPYYYLDMSHPSCDSSQKEMKESEKKYELLSGNLNEYDFLDVEFEFIQGNVYEHNVQKLIGKWAEDDNQYLSIFLAMSDQRSNFVLGMNMPDEVYDRAIPVFIRQERADEFVTNLRKADDKDVNYYFINDNEKVENIARKGRYANIFPFGMNDVAYSGEDEKWLQRAKLINYLYCNSKNYHFPDMNVLNAMPEKNLWKEVDEKWKGLKVAEMWSNLYSAYSILCKMDSLRVMRRLKHSGPSQDLKSLTHEEEELIAAVEHNRWNVEKLLMGYRKARKDEDAYKYSEYTGLFNSNNKKKLYIHHDIVPFCELKDVKQYDFEIVKFMPWILKKTGE